MDVCENLKERYYREDIFPRKLGIELVKLSPGYCRVRMEVREDMINFHGITHGGALFTLADTAFGLASNSRGATAVALQVSVNFTAPSRPGEVLEATAQEQTLTRSTGVYDIQVEKQDGSPVALFRGTVYRKKS